MKRSSVNQSVIEDKPIAARTFWVEQLDVPQANSIRRLIGLVRHIASGAPPTTAPTFHALRDVEYYLQAARAMRLVAQDGTLTATGKGLAQTVGEASLEQFTNVFAASPCGSTWLAWASVMMPAGLDARQAERFLEECTALGLATRRRRAATLRRWLHTLFPMKVKSSMPAPKKKWSNDAQLNIWEHEAPVLTPATIWPSPRRFPHNQGGESVRRILVSDFACSPSILIITGYASLDQIIEFLDRRDFGIGGDIRLMLGNDPYVVPKKNYPLGSRSLADEIRDYWLEQGVSVLRSGALFRIQQILKDQPIQLRIATRKAPVHAKIYCTEFAVTLGSSNYSKRGLETQTEANARFECTESRRYEEAAQLAEGIWSIGIDYRDGFLELLRRLFKPVSWREAVARACAALLEGEWAAKVLSLEHSKNFERLWPHQVQGISQALWVSENVGGVLVADATGSGKTLMGAWLLRATYLQQLRSGQSLRAIPLIIVPPQVREHWEEDLRETRLPWRVESHGPLSNKNSRWHSNLIETVTETELLALDEAHNYLGRSQRTRRMLSHYADRTILFTATPINRHARDLLGFIELLGADNLSEESISILRKLKKFRRGSGSERTRLPEAEVDQLKVEIERFMVRRTRSELNRIIAENREQYRLKDGLYAQYPEHKACYYECGAPSMDSKLAHQIDELASQLTGIGWVGTKLELPLALRAEGWSEEHFLKGLLKRIQAVARHFVMACLRSSRAALFEHIRGTVAAVRHYTPDVKRLRKEPTGNTIEKLAERAGKVPEWRFKEVPRSKAPSWLIDAEAHRATSQKEAAIYESIVELVAQMSEAREVAKKEKLLELSREGPIVLAFDAHLISLEFLALRLREVTKRVHVFTGADGMPGKRRAEQLCGLETKHKRLIILCSDTLSEGMNLQGASRVLHLDTPTVIRTAEQRAGRIDRINTKHPQVEIWWPRDPPEFAPRRRDLLRERNWMAHRLIGANLRLPDDDATMDENEVLTPEELARHVEAARQAPPELCDAFRPIRKLIGPDGLISKDDYDQIKTSKAKILNCVSIIAADQPWAFFVATGQDRTMPRWVFLASPGAHPMVDLSTISGELVKRLQSNPRDLPFDGRADTVMRQFVQRLQQTEEVLLPVRRQRALRLARKVLRRYSEDAWIAGDDARRRVARRIYKMLRPGGEEPYPDPRSMAEAWLRLIRPYQPRALARHKRRDWPWTIDALEPLLIEDEISTEQLQRAFEEIPLLQPIQQRIITMILGMPEEAGHMV